MSSFYEFDGTVADRHVDMDHDEGSGSGSDQFKPANVGATSEAESHFEGSNPTRIKEEDQQRHFDYRSRGLHDAPVSLEAEGTASVADDMSFEPITAPVSNDAEEQLSGLT